MPDNSIWDALAPFWLRESSHGFGNYTCNKNGRLDRIIGRRRYWHENIFTHKTALDRHNGMDNPRTADVAAFHQNNHDHDVAPDALEDDAKIAQNCDNIWQ